jgi:multiple sugar transport system ATP-binding protein
MNFLPATVQASGPAGVTLQLDGRADGELLRLAPGIVAPATGSRVTLGIRPEHLLPGEADGSAAITRRVRQVEHFGEYSYVYLDGPEGEEDLIAKVIGHSPARPGDNETFTIPSTQCHLFDATGFALPRVQA